MTPTRVAAVAVWALFACIVLGVLVARGDGWGVALGAAWALLALVEGAAIANPARGDTVSERVRSWARDSVWRKAALVTVMLFLAWHWMVQ